MKMSTAIEDYIGEMFAEGRFNSPRTERGYRAALAAHAEDVDNRDPRKTNRDDVIRTLRRWGHPNTRSLARSQLVSFYDWTVETGLRKDNPARQTRRPKKRKPTVYRLTRDEVRSLRAAVRGSRERAMIDFGVLAGLRAQELIGLQGRHLRRPGWIWVSDDIAKGSKDRWVPVLPELEHTFAECAQSTADDEFVIANRQSHVRGLERLERVDPSLPVSYKALHASVVRVGRRAAIASAVTPHMLRHAFGDHIARFAGIKVAQFVLGHESVSTTEGYTGQPSLDEVAYAMREFGYGAEGLPDLDRPASPLVVPVRNVAGLSAGCDPERDWSASGALLSPVLWLLWGNRGIREAARTVARA